MTTRRDVLKGASAAAASLVLPAPLSIALAGGLSCGCTRVHEPVYGHTCTIHDEAGRRWDSYSAEEVARQYYRKFEHAPDADDAWTCYCGRHDENELPEGTPCVWEKTSYEYDEWECKCLHSIRDDWLSSVTIDWIAAAKEGGLA